MFSAAGAGPECLFVRKRVVLRMGRSRRTSASDDMVDAVALLPWWAGVLLAAVFYVVLHYFASQPVNATPKPGQIGDVVGQTMVRTLATIGQYALPFLCLVGAAASAWRRRERHQLVKAVAASPAASVLDGMSWQQFERLVGAAFRLQGYQVVENGGGGADGGVDLVLTRNGEKHLVQCKQWRAFKVGVGVVRELYGVMAAKGAAGGFVVTSGRFTDEAVAFAQGRNVRLLDGPELHGLIQQARQVTTGDEPATNRSATAAVALMPSCPVCSQPMKRRVARRGSNAGRDFWGCTEYPTCKGTRPITDGASG
jgi:restriction system protein